MQTVNTGNGVIADQLATMAAKAAADQQDKAQQGSLSMAGTTSPSVNMGVVTGDSDYNGINLPGYTSQATYDPNSAYAQLANRKGQSPWAALSIAQQDNLATQQKDNDAAQANVQTGQADDNLAMQGGLTSGARERTAQEGAKNYLSMAQGVDRNAANNTQQIGVNDETNRISMLGTDNANQIASAQAQAKGQADYNQWLAGQENTAVGADKQAAATQASGGGSFLCTELRRQVLISGREYRALHAIGVTQIFKRLAFTKWYLAHAWKAVSLAQVKKSDLHEYAQKVRMLLREKDSEQVAMAYMQIAGQFCAEHGQKMPMAIMTKAFYPKFWSELQALPAVIAHPLVWKYIAIGLKEKVKGALRGSKVRTA